MKTPRNARFRTPIIRENGLGDLFLDQSLPRDGLRKIEHKEESLQPLYADLERHLSERSKRLQQRSAEDSARAAEDAVAAHPEPLNPPLWDRRSRADCMGLTPGSGVLIAAERRREAVPRLLRRIVSVAGDQTQGLEPDTLPMSA